jgi:hypothetical protein
MHSLHVIWVVVSSRCSHSFWFDMVGDDLAAISKWIVADSALSALVDDLPVGQLTIRC